VASDLATLGGDERHGIGEGDDARVAFSGPGPEGPSQEKRLRVRRAPVQENEPGQASGFFVGAKVRKGGLKNRVGRGNPEDGDANEFAVLFQAHPPKIGYVVLQVVVTAGEV
jgi:hypothetical protein